MGLTKRRPYDGDFLRGVLRKSFFYGSDDVWGRPKVTILMFRTTPIKNNSVSEIPVVCSSKALVNQNGLVNVWEQC